LETDKGRGITGAQLRENMYDLFGVAAAPLRIDMP
jgi:hypothetical protein